MAAQLLGHRLDLTGRNPLDIHLGQRTHQSPLRALVALKQLGRKQAGAIARNAQLDRADRPG